MKVAFSSPFRGTFQQKLSVISITEYSILSTSAYLKVTSSTSLLRYKPSDCDDLSTPKTLQTLLFIIDLFIKLCLSTHAFCTWYTRKTSNFWFIPPRKLKVIVLSCAEEFREGLKEEAREAKEIEVYFKWKATHFQTERTVLSRGLRIAQKIYVAVFEEGS